MALGSFSVADQPQTVSVGAPGFERRITNVAPGVVGTDAVNLNQLNSVDQRLSTRITDVDQRLSTAIGITQDQVRRFRDEAFRGIAATAALSSPSMPSAPGRTSWAINGSATERAGGFGVGLAHRLDTAVPIMLTGSVGVGFGGSSRDSVGFRRNNDDPTVVGRVGLGGEF